MIKPIEKWIATKKEFLQSVTSWGRIPKEYYRLQCKIFSFEEALSSIPENCDISEVEFNDGDKEIFIRTPTHHFHNGGFNISKWWENA